jgi:hypothetical protein
MAQAAALFSHEEGQYAFGELDDDGKTRLAQFAAQYRSTPDFRPGLEETCRSYPEHIRREKNWMTFQLAVSIIPRDAGAQHEIERQAAEVGAVAPHAIDLVRGSGVAPQSRVEAFAEANDATVAPPSTAI